MQPLAVHFQNGQNDEAEAHVMPPASFPPHNSTLISQNPPHVQPNQPCPPHAQPCQPPATTKPVCRNNFGDCYCIANGQNWECKIYMNSK